MSRPQSSPRAPTAVISQREDSSYAVRSSGLTARERVSQPASSSAGSESGDLGGEHLVGEVLQHDGMPRQTGHLADHLGRRCAVNGQLGEHLVQLLRRAQLGELGVDDLGVHRLGDVDEGRLAGPGDQRKAVLLGGRDERVGQLARVLAAQLDDQAADAHLRQFRDVRAEAGRGRPAARCRW